MAATNPSFMNGVPELLVLRLLSREAAYGYQLVQAVRAQTGEQIKLGEGSIYAVLHALEADGCITGKRREVEGRSRIYYSLTAAGKKRLAATERDFRRVSGAILQVLGG